MSNYDPKFKDEMPVKKNPREPQPGDDAGLRNRLSEAAVRGLPRPPSPPPQPPKKQQLPSLSSLFGPSSRPRQSPLRDGTGYFGSALPHAERHPISTSVPKGTFEPGFDEPPWVPPLPRPLPLPLSLRSREREQRHRPESRSDLGAGSSTWPTQGAASRSDYSLGSREHHLFASPEDVFATKLTGPRRDGDMISRNHEQFRTPVSAGPPEVMPVKDALGPKIWTGTHFLPRFVRQAEVPGEGLCYFYDDGSYCKTIIEGEQVNAHWGVTKAGKPRKRLAVACVTCREKKIKCDPDYPRCVQCEKFGRVCKYQSAPRGVHLPSSPSAPSAEPDEKRRSVLPTEYMRPSSHLSESVSPRTTHRPSSPDPTAMVPGPVKRMRIGHEDYPPPAAPTQPGPTRSSLAFSF